MIPYNIVTALTFVVLMLTAKRSFGEQNNMNISPKVQTCDPEIEECDFENEVQVEFDDAHSHLLGDQDVMTSFAHILMLWVNLHYKCIGKEDFFEEIDFNDGNSATKVWKGRGGSGKGRCKGKKCPPQPNLGFPKSNQQTFSSSFSVDPCENSFLQSLRRSNPSFFGDVESVEVSFDNVVYTTTTNTTSCWPFTYQNETIVLNHDCVPDDASDLSAVLDAASDFLSVLDASDWVSVLDASDRVSVLDASDWVSVSSDGSFIVTGASDGDFGLQIFSKNDTAHWTLAQDRPFPIFATDVSISASGESFIVAANVQAVVFCREGESWARKGQPLKAYCRWQLLAWLTNWISVAISDDGTTVAVGSPLWARVKVYSFSSFLSRWNVVHTLKNSIFEGPIIVFGSNFGNSIGMVSDNDGTAMKLIVGAYGDWTSNGDSSGSVSVFDLKSGSRTQKILGEASANYFGSSVSVAGDGSRFAVATDRYEEEGWVEIFEYDSSESKYEIVGSRIFVQDPIVSISGDGTKLLIGSPYNSEYGFESGKAFLYDIDGEEFNLRKEFKGRGTQSRLGTTSELSYDGSTIVVGTAYSADPHYVDVYYD